MAAQDGRPVDTSLDGDRWSSGAEADASRLWHAGHRTNDGTAEGQGAVRLASGRAHLRNQLSGVKSYTGWFGRTGYHVKLRQRTDSVAIRAKRTFDTRERCRLTPPIFCA